VHSSSRCRCGRDRDRVSDPRAGASARQHPLGSHAEPNCRRGTRSQASRRPYQVLDASARDTYRSCVKAIRFDIYEAASLDPSLNRRELHGQRISPPAPTPLLGGASARRTQWRSISKTSPPESLTSTPLIETDLIERSLRSRRESINAVEHRRVRGPCPANHQPKVVQPPVEIRGNALTCYVSPSATLFL